MTTIISSIIEGDAVIAPLSSASSGRVVAAKFYSGLAVSKHPGRGLAAGTGED
jgi:hypothetical protein